MKQETSKKIKNTAFLMLLSGLFLLGCAILLVTYGGTPKPFTLPNPQGFESAMIWLELVDSPAEVFAILGPIGQDQGIREALDRANHVDFVFMAAYALFNCCVFLFMHTLHLEKGTPFFRSSHLAFFGLILALIMVIGDIKETLALLELTKARTLQDITDAQLLSLKIFTRIKWAAIFLASLIIGLSYSSYSGFKAGLATGAVYLITAVLGFMSISLHEGRPLLEIAAATVGLAWLLSTIHGGLRFFRPNKNSQEIKA